MKVEIFVSGQINGNHVLKSACENINCEIVRRGMFNSYHLEYRTKGEAKKAIAEAKKWLRQNDYVFSASNESISYDASRANIVRIND